MPEDLKMTARLKMKWLKANVCRYQKWKYRRKYQWNNGYINTSSMWKANIKAWKEATSLSAVAWKATPLSIIL
jgi:hypothetical protein